MQRKPLLYILIVLFVFIIGVLSYKIYGVLVLKAEAKEATANLSMISGIANNGKHMAIPLAGTKNPFLIIYFNSECSYCEYEAKEIKANHHLFKGKDIYMISHEPLAGIQQFAQKFELDDLDNIHFLQTSEEEILKTFGSLTIPQIFIYNADKQLIKEFKGETKVEAIVNSFKKLQ